MNLYSFRIFQRDREVYSSLISATNEDEALEKIEFTFTAARPRYYEGDVLRDGDIVSINDHSYVLLPFGWVDATAAPKDRLVDEPCDVLPE